MQFFCNQQEEFPKLFQFSLHSCVTYSRQEKKHVHLGSVSFGKTSLYLCFANLVFRFMIMTWGCHQTSLQLLSKFKQSILKSLENLWFFGDFRGKRNQLICLNWLNIWSELWRWSLIKRRDLLNKSLIIGMLYFLSLGTIFNFRLSSPSQTDTASQQIVWEIGQTCHFCLIWLLIVY